MEYLTKQQIILLALFVSFFSSIATGIVVVSLTDQTAPAVSQTVNRVIERTIEKASPTTAAKETVIVKDDQAIVDAIAKASKAIVAITAQTGSALRSVGLGVIISGSGRIAAIADALPSDQVSAKLPGGNVVGLSFVSKDPASGISIYQAEQSTDPKDARAYTAAALGDSDALKLGQTVIAVAGDDQPSVSAGIVSSLVENAAPGPSSAAVAAIKASAGAFDSRSVLVNLLGEVVGMRDSADAAGNTASYVPSNIIKQYATS